MEKLNFTTNSQQASFPPGYRFIPDDNEVIMHYLLKKVIGHPLPPNNIIQVALHQHHPAYLAEMYKCDGQKECYFFTRRKMMKYRNGDRPSRSMGDGYWKPSGADKPIRDGDAVVGFRKALVFYEGKPPKGTKTDWIMQEYRVNNAIPGVDTKLDSWVLCKMYKKGKKFEGCAKKKQKEDNVAKIDFNSVREYLDSFPPGYHFTPLDEEHIVHYLLKKVVDGPLPSNNIHEVTLYQHSPADLAERYRNDRQMEYFFFTPRDRKYQNGKRPSRGTGNGYWRPTGADIPIWHNGAEIGSKKVLVYFAGKPPNGTKTNWIMHKFTTNNSEPRVRSNPDDMRLDDWVLCKIYERVGKANGRVEEEDNEAEHVQMDVEAATDTFAYDTMKDINKNFGYANDELMELDLAAILDWDFSGTITELLADDDHDPQPNEAIAAAPITISAAHADNIVNQTFVPSDHHQQPLGSRDQIFVPSNDQSFVPSNEHQEPIERSYDQIGMPPYDNHQQKPLGSYDQIFVPSGCHLQQPHCSHDQILVPAFSDQQPPLSSYEQIFVPLDHHQQKQLGSYDGNFVPSNYHQQPTRFCDQISAPFVDQTIVLSNDHQQQPFGSYDQIFVSSSDHKQPPLGSCDQMSIPTDDHQRDSGTYGQFFVPYDDQQLFAVADKVPISKNSAGGYCYVTESFGHCEGIVLEPMGMMSSGSYSTVISMQKQKLQQEIYDIERVEKQLDQSHFGDPLVAYYLDTSSFKFQFGNV